MSTVKKWSCANCGTMITWKMPYQTGERPYEFKMDYGKVIYTKQHFCKKKSFNDLPKVFVANTPNYILCGICRKKTTSCDECFYCGLIPSYCINCKKHVTIIHYSHSAE